jgi:hypothetical protein
LLEEALGGFVGIFVGSERADGNIKLKKTRTGLATTQPRPA